jgi:hypothetical protein
MENPGYNKFYFRDIHPNITLGTTFDRYAGGKLRELKKSPRK